MPIRQRRQIKRVVPSRTVPVRAPASIRSGGEGR
jgi:hypothetical protein